MSKVEKFHSAVMGKFYSAEIDEFGSRVHTSLSGTRCPRCKSEVEPNVEHGCGNRAPGRSPGKHWKPARPLKESTYGRSNV